MSSIFELWKWADAVVLQDQESAYGFGEAVPPKHPFLNHKERPANFSTSLLTKSVPTQACIPNLVYIGSFEHLADCHKKN